MSEPEISVVLATRDRPRRLAAQLAALRSQTLAADRYELVVVDDCSGQETVELLWGEAARSDGPSLRVIRRERASGPAAVRNAGWRAARAPVIAFTDDACVVTSGWLAALLDASRAHPGAIVEGETEPDTVEWQQAGPFCDTLVSRGVGPWFETVNILYPRALLERLDGFDEQSFPCSKSEYRDYGDRAHVARGGVGSDVASRGADSDLAGRRAAAQAARAARDEADIDVARSGAVTDVASRGADSDLARGRAGTELARREAGAVLARGGAGTDLAWRALAAGAEAVWAPRAVVFHAVDDVGWQELLRRAWRSDQLILCCKRHPALRQQLRAGVFWSDAHLSLALALLASSPRLPSSVRIALALPYARRLYAGPQTPKLAPFRLALDLTEAAACARGSARHRVVVI